VEHRDGLSSILYVSMDRHILKPDSQIFTFTKRLDYK